MYVVQQQPQAQHTVNPTPLMKNHKVSSLFPCILSVCAWPLMVAFTLPALVLSIMVSEIKLPLHIE